jgi:hypothetical protein
LDDAVPAAGKKVPSDRYGLLLAALVAVLAVSPFVGRSGLGRAAMVLAVAAAVVASFRATGVGRIRRVLILTGAAALALAPAAFAAGTFVQVLVLLALAVGMALGPPNLVRRIFEHDTVTLQLVIAGLCAYLQVGFGFAFVFGAIDAAETQPFFAQGEVAGFFDYVYFSFVTLTTVGYGDLSAVGDVGRALAILETLLGQLFLVVLVAYLVGRLSGTHPGAVLPDTRSEGAQPPIE